MIRIMSGVFLLFIWCAAFAGPQPDVRPIRDHIGYCWEPAPMNRLMDYLESSCRLQSDFPDFVGGIAPHDDYLYAGPVYLPLFRRIKAKEVVIFGVTHRTVRQAIGDPKDRIILETYRKWQGPYGRVPVSPLRDRIREEMPANMIMVSNEAHRLEHSIEGMVPFLQYQVRDIKITPIMVTAMSLERMEDIGRKLSVVIGAYMTENHLKPGQDIFFLISSDANHYGPDFNNTRFGTGDAAHDAAVDNDWRIAETCLSGTLNRSMLDQFMKETAADQALWCGHYSIPFGLTVMRDVLSGLDGSAQLHGTFLRYSDSYSAGPIPLRKMGFGVTAPFSLDHWVGHLSMGYWMTAAEPKTESGSQPDIVRKEPNQ